MRTIIAAAVFCALAVPAAGQGRALAAGGAGSGRRLALVIGNSAYPAFPLKNPASDARAMSAALRDSGFTVSTSIDANLRDLTRQVDAFIASLGKNDVALVFYAGHGMQINGENYIIPVDFTLKDEADAPYQSYSASRIVDRLNASGVRLSIVILDACRNNPFRSARSGTRGLAPMDTGRGTLIAFATAPNDVAADNPAGNNGLFTTYVLEAMKEPGVPIEQMFSHVRQRVYDASGGKQVPWLVSSVLGDFSFRDVQTPMPNPASYVPKPTVSIPAPAPALTEPPAASFKVVGIDPYYVKAVDGKVYMPFLVTGRGGQTPQQVAIYYRLTPLTGGKPVYEDYLEYDLAREPIPLPAASVTAPPGNYRLSVAMGPPAGANRAEAIRDLRRRVDAADASVYTEDVTLPNFATTSIDLSSVIPYRHLEPLRAPRTPAEQSTHPFSFGMASIEPSVSPVYARTEDFQVYGFVYGEATNPQTGKPDVELTFEFFNQDQHEKFFNRTNPVLLNASTLAANFDLRVHVLQYGQAVPLASFTPGRYRLVITANDRVTGSQRARAVYFSVQ